MSVFNIVMPSVIMPGVVMVNVFMLNVVAPPIVMMIYSLIMVGRNLVKTAPDLSLQRINQESLKEKVELKFLL